MRAEIWNAKSVNDCRRARASAEIVRQLADAIQAAHDQQIIHRDLKPANVLCEVLETVSSPANDNGRYRTEPAQRISVKLTDFGLARILHETSDQTKSGFAIGTPSFMSPEQAAGQLDEIGKATDIYGLGAILYELLTGDPPFQGETATETIRQVRLEAPIPPSQRNLVVPRDLELICLQCLEKQPENRYASARDLADDLRRFLLGRSVAAHPVGRVRKWLRRCRRHPLYSLALLSVAILIIAIWMSLFFLNRAREQLKTKDLEIEQARANVPAPELPSSSPALPTEVQNVLARLREGPTITDHAQQLANLGDDWLERLPAQFPEDLAVRLGVGEAQFLLQQSDKSLSSFEQSRRIGEEQTARSGGGAETWACLAFAHERIGDIHLLKQDLKTASRDFDRSIALREMLFQDDPHEQRWALQLASICGKQGKVYTQENDWSTALSFHGRRLGLLIEQFPNSPALKAEIRETHLFMAALHQKLGNTKAMEYHLKEAEKFQKSSP